MNGFGCVFYGREDGVGLGMHKLEKGTIPEEINAKWAKRKLANMSQSKGVKTESKASCRGGHDGVHGVNPVVTTLSSLKG